MGYVNQANKAKQPSLSQLRAFAAVAEHLHFRDAAASIGMSQPALSGAVSALEVALGVQLIERTTRKVLLSPAGERLAVRAEAVLEAVGELMEEAEAVRAPFTGVLRLGVIPTVAPYLLPTVLRLVHERYPELDLQVHEEQTSSLLEGLAAGRLDLLLLAVPLGVPGVIELPLFDEDFVLVMERGHELGGRKDIPRETLRDLPLLLLDEGHCLRDQALDICREAGRTQGAPVTTTAAGLSTLVQLVAGGLGVTLLPRTAVTVETARNESLVTGYFSDPAPSRRVALAVRAGTARHAEFEEFAAALREAMEALPVRTSREAPEGGTPQK
ncbi:MULTISPECIES: hydrogen peroxide-inducible genes activator [unclassified Streptomyces]|uniref:hydrogen peroxide-inducible genes activator n=1 Tax=unclassified Streptomyces TaxID=2593676 RepID=UPI0001C1C52F|nr:MULTISPECIES: hydrogen peroxide-inducible genes activator [unclassified Streptomyces]MYR68170.1 LysR family transcriptional regulator [Streptomyces sp. SID4939]MYR99900.1 LysR family transcriptional regulator [Streptomyces sp. SID4940]MYT66838.1 LysR family transcriptional regulator [Streptomyces sp. SID8357]MYT88385.1 LysR family transcriptional regulator [Streptomyces sp. SID8360]MYW39576.1 LysR family transcriptional regulator [Streptomyces sp. SID1]MYX76226.1 LysR family transcriptiona